MGCLNSVPATAHDEPNRPSQHLRNTELVETKRPASSPHKSSAPLSPKQLIAQQQAKPPPPPGPPPEEEDEVEIDTEEDTDEILAPPPSPPASSPVRSSASRLSDADIPPPAPVVKQETMSPIISRSQSTPVPATGGPVKKTLAQMLHPDRQHSDPGAIENFTKLGKSGWLNREDKDDARSFTTKVWAIIAYNQLRYYSAKPSASDLENPYGARGYMELSPSTLCRASKEYRYAFKITDHGITVTFSTTSADEYDEWVECIQAAVNGVRHTLPAAPAAAVVEKKVIKTEFVEMPRKTGVMKKKSIEGKAFGIKNTKTRWFRLEGGELRYYSDESMRPSKLKKSINLKGCKVPKDVRENTITVELTDGNNLFMEAANNVEALEWHHAIKETISIINGQRSDGKKRRSNVTMNKSDEKPVAVKKEHVVKSPHTEDVIRSALKQHFLLSTLSDFTPIINAVQLEIALPGDVIIWQGSVGDLFYILETGEATVFKDGAKVAQIVAGKAFGELALINDTARTATIRSSQICRLWTLDRKTLRHVLSSQENVVQSEKVNLLRNVELFKDLTDSTFCQIADVMQLKSYKNGERIIKQGDVGDCLYIIKSGTVCVTQSSLSGSTTELVRLSTGKCFGELALLSNEPRKANVHAVSDVQCYSLDSECFKRLLGTLREAVDESVGMNILKNVKLLSGLNEKQMAVVARNLVKEEFEANQEIIRQGQEGDKFYMIASGAVAVFVNHAEVAKLKEGSYFGETALLNNERRNATITATEPTTCFTLNRHEFVKLLGPLDAILKEESERRARAAREGGLMGRTRAFSRAIGSITSTLKRTMSNAEVPIEDINGFRLSDLSFLRVIGKGTYGVIKLMHHTQSNVAYALKTYFKQPIADAQLQDMILHERDVLKSFDHPFVPPLYASFQDADCLYMMMEYLNGGDMWALLYEKDVLPAEKLGGIDVESAKYYVANVLVALEYIHKHDIVHRDINPENLVVDRAGYIKIVDFAYSKRLSLHETTNTLCGTPEYMAPEMVLSKGHNRGVDMWALGILLYELLTRTTPFESNDVAGTYQRIIHCNDNLATLFKPHFDAKAKDLIIKLLAATPGTRLGMLRNGTEDIWNHPFFAGVSSIAVEEKAFTPAYIPEFEDMLDEGNVASGDETLVDVPKYSGKIDFSSF